MIIRRTLLGMSIDDCWFDHEAYQASSARFAILRHHLKYPCDLRIVEHTRLIDLSPSLDILYGNLASRARHSITSSDRSFTVARVTSMDELELFSGIYTAFAEKKGLTKPTEEELRNLDIFLARSTVGEIVHGAAFIKAPDRSVYRYRYSVAVRKSQANAALVWNAICSAKAKGYAVFDLGGTTNSSDTSFHRIDFFKSQFGGKNADFYVQVNGNSLPFKLALQLGAAVLGRPAFYRKLVRTFSPVLKKGDTHGQR